MVKGYAGGQELLNDMGDVINPAIEEKQVVNWAIEVSRGNVEGTVWNPIGGINPNMDQDTEETIWDQGGIYTYLTADTQLFASSSSASDTSVDILVFGLDDTYTEISRTVTVTGQSQVALSGLMFRVHGAVVSGSTEPVGDIYIAETDTLTGGVPDTVSKIKAKITQGNNITQMALFTVPAGKTAYAVNVDYISGKGDAITYNALARPDGGVFISAGTFELYQTAKSFGLPGVFQTEKTDIEFRGTADNPDAVGTVFYDFVLIDN